MDTPKWMVHNNYRHNDYNKNTHIYQKNGGVGHDICVQFSNLACL